MIANPSGSSPLVAEGATDVEENCSAGDDVGDRLDAGDLVTEHW